jgi:hypothetical protein
MRQRLEGLVEQISGGDSYVWNRSAELGGSGTSFAKRGSKPGVTFLSPAAVVLLTTDN